jgi:hypothetical protein
VAVVHGTLTVLVVRVLVVVVVVQQVEMPHLVLVPEQILAEVLVAVVIKVLLLIEAVEMVVQVLWLFVT